MEPTAQEDGGPSHAQSTEQNENNDRIDISSEMTEHFGDQLISNDNDNTLRIGFININGIPKSADHPKNKIIFNSINNKKIGILGMAEVNKCWHLLNDRDKWKERTRGWWEDSHSSFGYNRRDTVISSPFQPGGTALISIGNVSHRVIESGSDSSGLGRWAWTLYKGKNNITLRIISAYRPCKPTLPGPNTAYNQQQRFFDRNSDTRDPRDAVLEDLGRNINIWRGNGDQIILMADFNEDVENAKIRRWSRAHQLTNAISILHQLNDEPTYHRGSKSIDGIFVSHTVNPIKCGYLPFGAFPSDHRCLWIEISTHNAFGYNPPKSTKFQARRLKSDDPKVRNKWLLIYETYIKKHNLHNRQFQLETNVGNYMTPDQVNEYEYIRRKRLEGIKVADKGCRKLRMGNVPFSDKYKDITDRLELWKGVITKKRHCTFSQSKLRRLEKRTGIRNSLHCTLDEAREKEKETFIEYWEFKKRAKETRATFLEIKAKAIANESNTKDINVIQQLITRERQREAARRVKATLHKIQKSGIAKVEVEHANGNIEEITTKEGIEQACMDENKGKFLQTSTTPCMQEPLRSLLGKFGDTEFAQSILSGQCIPPPNTPQYTRELFQQLQTANFTKRPPPINQISTTTFQSGWKKMKERTSSGISGLHFGHLKACAMRDLTSQFEASLSHIPYCTGYCPRDWSVGVNVMIQKKEKVNLVSKLRTITLTEADFNFNNKLLGKQTIEHSEVNNLIAKEQYGSRNGKSAIEHAVHKRLTFDIMRQTRTNGALCSNDAKSCYDRILHSIASLAFQRLGIPFPPVQCMLQSIQNMKHHIRTSFGDSAFTMDNDGALIPFQGALQGNGASPAMWVIISTPLLNMLRTAGNGGYFIESISKKLSHSVGYAFVDDTDLIQYDARDQDMSIEEVMDRMQESINRWEGGLKATGGAIVPQKSFVYPVVFDFEPSGEWKYRSTNEIDYNFTVPDHNDVIQPLQQLEVSEGKCTLGVYLAPNGNNNDAVHHMCKKAEEWGEYINTGHLTRQDAWLATETTIMKSLLYPLPALTLTEKECTHIMAPVLDAGLRSTAICKNFPRAVAYGPKEEGGLQIQNLYTQQGISHISLLTEHIGENDMTGELLRTSIEAAKVEVGVGRNLFSLDFDLFQHLCTECWIKGVWKFAYKNNIEVMDKTTNNLQLHRRNDIFLMEIIVNHGFSRSELEKINRCRLYLQVTTLSDITCGYGTKFTQSYNCQYDHTIPHHYLWPKQPKPSASTIKIWRKALRQCFPRINGTMEYTLGDWLYRPSTEWKWFFFPQSQLIYQRHGLLWRIWRRSSRAGNLGQNPRYKYDTNGISRHPQSVRATITRQGPRNLLLTGWSNHDNDTPFTFTESHNTDWILRDTTRPDNIHPIITSIQEGNAIAVSDGSYLAENQASAAGWIIEDSTHLHRLKGVVEGQGSNESQCSHRSELLGILSIITHANKICNQHHIQQGHITIGCDGQGAIQIIDSPYKSKPSHKHFDIINSIKRSINNSKIQWSFQHIKGHQDDMTDFADLDRPAQLNVVTDQMAKRKLSATIQIPNWNNRRPQHLPFEPIEVYWVDRYHRRTKICSQMQKTLTNKIHTKIIRAYWTKKSKFSLHTESYIDWISSKKSRNGLTKQRQQWLSKWMTGFCGTGKMLKIYKYQAHSKCPRCEENDETTLHVLRCPHIGANNIWTKSIQKLEQWMTTNLGHPELIELIILGLNIWHRDERIPITYDILEPTLQSAWTKQRRLSWTSFIEGFWANDWRLCQAEYLKQKKSQKSSTLWISRVQRRIWLIAWELWEHRNQMLHNGGKTIHSYETRAIDEEIAIEWETGLGQLPPKYSHLFQGDSIQRREEPINNKMMWIFSIWSARDNDINIGPMRIRNSHIVNLFDRWKSKNAIEED